MRCPIYFNGCLRHIYIHDLKYLYVIIPLEDNKSVFRLVKSQLCKSLIGLARYEIPEVPIGYQFTLF